jgi:hypothetical protein
MANRIAVFKVRDSASADQLAELERDIRSIPQNVPSVKRVSLGPELITNGVWTYVWDVEFDGVEGIDAYLNDPWHIEHLSGRFSPAKPASLVEKIDFIYYTRAYFDVKAPDAKDPFRRLLMSNIPDTVAQAKIDEFEETIRRLPAEVPTVGNSALGKATAHKTPTPWTHVRESEFVDEEAMQAYQEHPFHTGVLRPFFHPDFPESRLVDKVINVCYRPPSSFIAD